MDIAKLALTGILGGSLVFGAAGCTSDSGGDGGTKTQLPATDTAYADVHGCAGLNSCKGLGGCKVTKEKLAELADKRGLAADKAGQAHSCKGLNECKGLGGCSVDAARFADLKAAQAAK